MKVTFVGELNIDIIAKKLLEVTESTIQRLEKEHGVKINGTKIHEADFSVKFDVEGMDEPQMLTVNHHGMAEPFQWIVDMDENTEINNQEKSMFDEYTVKKYQGVEHEFKEVKSEYKKKDLTKESSEEFGDMSKVVYQHKDGFKVVQVFQNKKLIQEYKLIPKKEQA
ncbi:hypothetical protein V7128_07460 [Neobacillus vireti]|uniref:hypothetical protein n=1 Tax=Neobacillus vireti TaxID=220686 RepID=UPI003000BA4B